MTVTIQALPSPGKRRLLAGVSVLDTPLVSRAIEYAREHSEPFLFNHVMRSWLFAVLLSQQRQSAHDEEVLAVSAILHDLGMGGSFKGPLRFEVEGANAAREFVLGEGVTDERAQLVWDAVALHSTPSISLFKEFEVALCTAGIGLDWAGSSYEKLTEAQIGAVVDAFPRLEMKRSFSRAVCCLVSSRASTTYDNFAGDFGERFVPGYERPSAVDFLLNAPFQE